MTARTNRMSMEANLSERTFWIGLSDWVTDQIGSAAAGSLVREAYTRNDPTIAIRGINELLDITIADAESDLAAQSVYNTL